MRYAHSFNLVVTVVAAGTSGNNNTSITCQHPTRLKAVAITCYPDAAAGNTMIPFYRFVLTGGAVAEYCRNPLFNQANQTIVGGQSFIYDNLDVGFRAADTLQVYGYVNTMNTDVANQTFTFYFTLWYEDDLALQQL